VTQDNLKYVLKYCMGIQCHWRCWVFAPETKALSWFKRAAVLRSPRSSGAAALCSGRDVVPPPRPVSA